MEPVNNNNQHKRERESLEKSENVDSVSSPSKRQKVESKTVVENIDDLDLLPSEQREIDAQAVNNGALIVVERPSLLEVLLIQSDHLSFFADKNLTRMTRINKHILRRYLEFARKHTGLSFHLDISSNIENFNSKVQNMIRKTENINASIDFRNAPRGTFERDDFFKKLSETRLPIHLSPWKNITLDFNFHHKRYWGDNGIISIDMVHSDEINVLKLRWYYDENDISAMIRLMVEKNINIIEIDVIYGGTPSMKYRLVNHNGKKITSIKFEKKIITISTDGDEDCLINWDKNQPLINIQNLEYLDDNIRLFHMDDILPLSLKSVVCTDELRLMDLYRKENSLESITIEDIDYEDLQPFLDKCTTKNIIVLEDIRIEKNYRLPTGFKVTLPVTLESCVFNRRSVISSFLYEDEDRYTPEPFLDFSLTSMISVKTDPKSVLTLPLKCVHIDLTYMSMAEYNEEEGDSEDEEYIKDEDSDDDTEDLIQFLDEILHPEIIEAWVWPMNMESLIIETSNHFNHNPDVPRYLKYLKFNRMNVNPNLQFIPSGVILEATIPKGVDIDFTLFPDVFIGMHITAENAKIFQNIGHLHNLKRLSIRITKSVSDTIVFRCPVNLQDFQISAHITQYKEMHILPNNKLSRVVYNNIKITIDGELYKGALYRQQQIPGSLYRISD